MRRNVITAAIALLGIPLLGATNAVDPLRNPVALHNPRVEVLAAYQSFAATPAGERRSLYDSYPVALREDLWLLHLEQFLSEHPQLTPNQRGVVLEAIGLLATGALQERANSEDPEGMTDSLARLERHIEAEFPFELARAAFAQLGPSAPPGDRPRGPGLQPRPEVYVGLDCDCNVNHPFCDTITNPTPYCSSKKACKALASGCGWLWLQRCDGLCSSTP